MQAVSLFEVFFLMLIISFFFHIVLMTLSSFSHFHDQLLKMIINEQHDLDKAKENVYILQKGLLFFFFVVQTRFFITTSVSTGYQPRKKKSESDTSCAICDGPNYQVQVLQMGGGGGGGGQYQTVDVNFVTKAGNVQ